MANELQEVLDDIQVDKFQNLKPENIKSGVKVLGVEGTLNAGVDTTDATATPADLINPKTAYVNGKKIIGEIALIEKAVTTSKVYELRTIKTNFYAPAYYDSYATNDVMLFAYISDSNLNCIIMKNNTVLLENSFSISSAFTFTTVQALAVHLVSSNASQIIFEVGITYRNGSTYHYSFNTLTLSLLDDTLTLGTPISTSFSGYSGNNSTLWSVKTVQGRFVSIIKYNSDDYFLYVTTNWSTKTAKATYASLYHGNSYNPNAKITGNYNWLIQPKFAEYLNSSSTTIKGYSNAAGTNAVYISPNNKYMFVGNVLYRITPNTNYTTMYNSKVKIADIIASDAFFTENEEYLYVRASASINIYKIVDNTVTLTQTIPFTNHTLTYAYGTTSFLVFDGTNTELVLFYIPTSSLTVEGLIRQGQNFIRLTGLDIPGTSKVLMDVEYKNQDGDYVKGTMSNNGTLNYNSSQEDQIIPEGYTAGGTIKAVTSSIDENIKAENIKEGVSILGITGTLSGGASTEGVKLFKTVSLMNNDTNPILGDLAVVYSNENKNIEGSSQFSKCICPQEVVLDTPITDMDYLDLSFKAVDSSYTLDCYGTLDPTMFYLTIMNGYDYIDITYSSTDGITYTRTDGGSDEVDFGTVIQYSYPEYFDERIGYFFQIQEALFNGLYKYNGTSYVLAESQISALPEYVYKKIFYGANGVQTGSLGAPDNTLIDVEAQLYSDIIKTYHKMPEITMDNDTIIDKNIILLPSRFDGTSVVNTSSITNLAEKFKDCNKLLEVGNIDTSNVTDMRQCFHWCNSLYSIGNLNTSKVTNMSEAFAECTNLVHIGNLDTSNVNNMSGIFEDCSNLKYIPKLNTMKAYYMNSAFYGCYNLISVADVTLDNVSNIAEVFSGCKNLQSLPLLNITKATNMAYSFKNCRQLKDINITNTVNATNMAQAFADCVNLVNVPNIVTNKTTDVGYLFMNCTNLTSIPALNFNNVTNAPLTFANCTNLVEISSLNFSKTINVPGLYQNCTNLTSIPVTSYPNAKDVSSMFAKCTNLTSIPSLNVINATSAYFMFDCCTNLTASPTMNLHKATYIRYLFNNCTNLKDIPSIINICNATEAQKIFNNCPNLTNTALNNVLGSLQTIGSNYSGTKSLAYIGLSNTQAEICTTLSNWTSLNSNGWVTGY